MGTEEILTEINKLTVNQRLALIELTIKNLRQEEKKDKLQFGANSLYNDYVNDKDLVAFQELDQEDFYETR